MPAPVSPRTLLRGSLLLRSALRSQPKCPTNQIVRSKHHDIASLPPKTPIEWSRESVWCASLNESLHLDFPSSNCAFRWADKPKNVLVISKIGDPAIDKISLDASLWMSRRLGLNVILERHMKEKCDDLVQFHTFKPYEAHLLEDKVDLVISLGGDGTMLHVSSLFQKHVPPVVSFSMGTLGFLMPFGIHDFEEIVSDVVNKGGNALLRMRLKCSYKMRSAIQTPQHRDFHVLNEAVLNRGRDPSLISIDIFVNETYLTSTLTDGLILASPTGSTAYSLSAGGSVVHPSVNGLLLTPICPRSLSFRPAIVPPDSRFELRVASHYAESSLDGKASIQLSHNDSLSVSASPYPFPTLVGKKHTFDWTFDVNELLKWNQKWGSRSKGPKTTIPQPTGTPQKPHDGVDHE